MRRTVPVALVTITAFLVFSPHALPAADTAEVTTHLDVAYGSDQRQTLDWYLPAPAAKGFPTVVWVYGGGWHAGSGKSSAPIAERLALQGVACVLVTHRLSPQHHFPA